MGDMREVFDGMKQDARERRDKRREDNFAIISKCGIVCEIKGDAILFRGDKSADFYPGAGRWRDHRANRTRRGGAKAFLRWLDSEAGR